MDLGICPGFLSNPIFGISVCNNQQLSRLVTQMLVSEGMTDEIAFAKLQRNGGNMSQFATKAGPPIRVLNNGAIMFTMIRI